MNELRNKNELERTKQRIVKNKEVYKDYILIDQRAKEVYDLEHIDGAFNWVMQLSSEDKTDEAKIEKKKFYQLLGLFNKWGINKDAVIELYCYGGDCAGRTVEMFKRAGYPNAVNLGGYQDVKNKIERIKSV